MSAYEDHISVLTFAGLNQSAETNLDLKYAVDGFGFDVDNGVMKSVNGETLKVPMDLPITPQRELYLTPLKATISMFNNVRECMLGVIHKRRSPHADEDLGQITEAHDITYYVVIVCGNVYCKEVDGLSWQWLGNIFDGTMSDAKYDCVTYELNYSPPVEIASVETLIQDDVGYVYFDKPQFKYVPVTYADNAYTYIDKYGQTQTLGTDALVRKPYEFPADALFVTDWQCGLWCIYSPPDGEVEMARVPVKDDVKFSCISMHAERLWGGGIEGDPDKLMYSAPHDPFCWEQNDDSPADGAGDVLQPNFDGDKFLALRSFGGQLLAFKKRRIWRLLGSSPEDFTFREQFGGGAIVENSIAVHGMSVYFISEHGLTVYDGNTASVIAKGKYKGFIPSTRYPESMNCLAGFDGDVYCLTFTHSQFASIDDDYGVHFDRYETLVRYDTRNGSVTARRMDEPVLAIAQNGKDVLYVREVVNENPANSSEKAFNVFLLNPSNDYLEYADAGRKAFKWISAYQDMGQSNVVKSGFLVYMTVDAPVEMTIGIRTEKKLKQKVVTFTPNKPKRIQINNSGRRFRLEMSADAGGVPFKILGGVQIHLEYDVD